MSERNVHQENNKSTSTLGNALLDLAKVVLPAMIAVVGQYITVVVPLQNQVKDQQPAKDEARNAGVVGKEMDVALDNLYTVTKFLHSKTLRDNLAKDLKSRNNDWDDQCVTRSLAVLKNLGMTASIDQRLKLASGFLNDEFIVIECHSENAFIMVMGITRKSDTIKKIDPLTKKAVIGLELAYKGDLFSS